MQASNDTYILHFLSYLIFTHVCSYISLHFLSYHKSYHSFFFSSLLIYIRWRWKWYVKTILSNASILSFHAILSYEPSYELKVWDCSILFQRKGRTTKQINKLHSLPPKSKQKKKKKRGLKIINWKDTKKKGSFKQLKRKNQKEHQKEHMLKEVDLFTLLLFFT